MNGPADAWAQALADWRIPDHILAAAPRSPWIHPVELFRTGDGPAPDTPSHARARERLSDGDGVLDVGCGGGRAAFAVAPPAGLVVGVDHQQGMLDNFAAAADARGLAHQEVLGDWPDVAAVTPSADVVVCHHVVYNVAALVPFVTALSTHARRRVVLELPTRHPLSGTAPFWRHFWQLERPGGPTADDALAVLRRERADGGDAVAVDTSDDLARHDDREDAELLDAELLREALLERGHRAIGRQEQRLALQQGGRHRPALRRHREVESREQRFHAHAEPGAGAQSGAVGTQDAGHHPIERCAAQSPFEREQQHLPEVAS
jgi:SAM-dependent methyltransferase